MLRDAIALVVNRDLRLVKPGSQGGVDMATDLSEGWPSVAVETKRHSDGKSLRLDQLKAKLFDAVQQRPKLDLIVFGALALRELRSLALGINLNNDGRTTANPATFRHAL